MVFFLPTVHGVAPSGAAGEQAVVEVPTHPQLKLIDGGAEDIGGGNLWRRRLITMQKI